MGIHPTRTLAWIWAFFLIRGLFYASFTPMWEGLDEWAHYAVIQSASPVVSREVEASLELAPMPWQMSAPRAALKHDVWWSAPEAERLDREGKLRSLPAGWSRETAEGGERSYELQQAPLYYWLLRPVYYLTTTLTLPVRVWLLRALSLLIASVVVPLGFLAAREVFRDDRRGLAVAALIAAFPGLMMTVSHIGNDSLAVASGSLCLLSALRWKAAPRSIARAALLGAALGIALLTKAYFLALLPPLLVFGLIRARRETLLICALACAISGWWYWRNWTLTHTLSGNQFAVAAGGGLLEAALKINWIQAADFTFLSHIWLGNWSFLVVRSWMYRIIAALAVLACAGLIVRLARLRETGLLLLSGIYVTFLAALAYHAAQGFQVEGFAGALGHYPYAIVIAEAILLAAGLGRATPLLAICLAALEWFGMTFLLIPYYTGFITHLPDGKLPALAIGQLQNGGAATMLARLTVNKPPLLTAPVMAILWIAFLAATAGLIAVVARMSYAAKFFVVGRFRRDVG